MPEHMTIDNIMVALQHRFFPTVTLWNRLEARPRADNFDRALTAEIRDPLWMLTRQWQMGEFEGDDAGSPISAKIRVDTTRLTEYQPAAHPVQAFRDDVPMEGLVEQRPLPFEIADQAMSLDLRLLMGRQWLKMLAKSVGDFADAYALQYPITVPDPTAEEQAAFVAHPEVWQRAAAVAGRMMDGYAFYRHVLGGGDPNQGTGVPTGQQDAVRDLAGRFVAWFEDLFLQPETPDDDAWLPSNLEYGFSASAPRGSAQRRFVAEEYFHGRLDWYNVDVDPEPTSATIAAADPQDHTVKSFVPVPVTYEGMPNTRWWAFEDRKTNFGQITPNTTELGKLLFIEFSLVHANDWFLFPHALPAGSIANIEGLVVTNVFGERTWVEASGSGDDEAWQRWRMFGLNTVGDAAVAADTSLLLLPTVPKIQEGRPIEDVAMVRDEMANMVWAVESTIPLPSGESKPGREAAKETAAFHAGFVAALGGSVPPTVPPVPPKAPISYRVMSQVDENWIPFVPVHVENDNREVQLQRAAMPRIIDDDPRRPKKIEPRTALLREGLDSEPTRAYYVHEEEVPRAGIRVYQAYQRARWYGGRAVTWLGVRKQTGRGSGSSGLVFDYLEDTPS